MVADVVTRVSEYVPQIVDYVAKIIANDYAYEANGSVYFDVGKFDAEPNHYYAKVSVMLVVHYYMLSYLPIHLYLYLPSQERCSGICNFFLTCWFFLYDIYMQLH